MMGKFQKNSQSQSTKKNRTLTSPPCFHQYVKLHFFHQQISLLLGQPSESSDRGTVSTFLSYSGILHLRKWILTLPVPRYLVPTLSTRGRGVSRPSMISKMVDSTNFNFGRPLGPSMRGKTCRVYDLSIVMFPWQLIYVRVFSTKF